MSKNKKSKLSFDDIKKTLDKYGLGDKKTKFDVISTGSLTLDLATGIGGFPRGRLVETYGWESSGKTYIAQKVCANAIAKGLKVAYIDTEHAIDPAWAKQNGFDIYDEEHVLFVQPDTVEDACNIALDLTETGEVAVIVMDSLSSMSPAEEMENEVGKYTMGVKARLLSQFSRKIKGPLSRNNTLLITIGQLRESIGGNSYGDNSVTDYGNAMRFLASIRVRYYKGIEKDASGVPFANRTTAKLDKNKCASPHTKGSYDIIFGEGIDNDKELILLAEDHKVIQKAGSWYKMGEESLGQGTNGVKRKMLEDPNLKTKLIQGINDYRESEGMAGRLPFPTQSDEVGSVRELPEENNGEASI